MKSTNAGEKHINNSLKIMMSFENTLVRYKIPYKRMTIDYSKYFKKSSCEVLACSIIDFNTPTFIGLCLGTVTLRPYCVLIEYDYHFAVL
jgi:hypothetical protein